MRNKKPSNYAKTIAIDGPAASGKSTVGAKLAQELGYVFVDAGTLYRSVTRQALEEQVDIHDAQTVAEVARGISFSASMVADGTSQLRVNGKLVRDRPYDPQINMIVPVVAAHPEVRAAVREKQHLMARLGFIVCAGRDIGTVVMPDAELKIFIDASLDIRASRRLSGLLRNNFEVTLEAIRSELEQRDHMDSTRQASPMRPAEDAIILNSDDMKIAAVLTAIKQHAKRE